MQKSRPVWLIALPLAAVLVIAVGWSLFWYIAAENAKLRFAQAQTDAETAGREIDCRDASWGGFPFRISLECSSARFGLAGDGRVKTIDTGALSAVALAYRPWHVIAEIAGPITIAAEGPNTGHLSIQTPSAPVRVSIVLQDWRPDQVSVLAEDINGTVDLTLIGAPQTDALDFAAQRVNIHARAAAAPQAGAVPIDIAARLDEITSQPAALARIGEETLRIATLQFDAHLTEAPTSSFASFSDAARRWQQSDGRLTVNVLRFDSNIISTSSAGEIRIDEEGRLNGDLTTAVRGFDAFLARLRDAGIVGSEEAAAAETIMIVLAKAVGDPENPALEIRTDLKKGRFYFGPFKITTLAPLF